MKILILAMMVFGPAAFAESCEQAVCAETSQKPDQTESQVEVEKCDMCAPSQDTGTAGKKNDGAPDTTR